MAHSLFVDPLALIVHADHPALRRLSKQGALSLRDFAQEPSWHSGAARARASTTT